MNPRNFNSISVPGLSDEARKAVNAAFDAMSTWCIETANNNEKNSVQVIDKLAAAARAHPTISLDESTVVHHSKMGSLCRRWVQTR